MSSPTDQLQTLSIAMNLDTEPRKILGLAGNRVVKEVDHLKKNKKKKKDVVEIKTTSSVKLTNRLAKQVVIVKKNDESVDSSCSSKSTSSSSSSDVSSSVKKASSKRREKMEGDGTLVVRVSIPFRRCHWITQFSDRLHVSFHDEEWGVPVHEDNKLFELLVLSQASAELTWPEILYKRDKFRKLFENFNPPSTLNSLRTGYFRPRKMVASYYLNKNCVPLWGMLLRFLRFSKSLVPSAATAGAS